MLRHAQRAAGARILARAALLLALPGPAAALPLISEVFYDAAGSDDGKSFVELYGAPGSDLTGYRLEGVNGANGAVTPTVELLGAIPSDGFFVVADVDGGGLSAVPAPDLLANFDFQNGPDSIVLRGPGGVVDAVGYGDFGAGETFAGEGAPAPDVPADASLARRFADVDSDDNAADFVVQTTPSPGGGPLSQVPEPGAGPLLAGGLALLAGRARVSRRRP
jgi:hypothetical protein